LGNKANSQSRSRRPPSPITVTETAIAPPSGFVDYSPVYEIEPAALTFFAPATLTVPFSNGRGSDVFDENLAIFWSVSADSLFTFEPLAGTSVNAGFARASTLHGGYALVGYGSPGTVPYCN
jgi:hypothetical protein